MYDGFNPRVVNDDARAPFYGAELPQLPDIEANRDDWTIVSWDITPGDVVLVHPGVLHGGGPTPPDGRRRTLTPGLSLQLSPGDPLRHPWYPQVRPKPAWQRPG